MFEKLFNLVKKIQNWPQKKFFELSKTVSLKLGGLREGEDLVETLVFEKLFGEKTNSELAPEIFFGLSKTVSLKLGNLREGEDLRILINSSVLRK